MVLDLVEEALRAKLNEKTILSGLTDILQRFIVTSEAKKIPLSNETESLIKKASKAGISFIESSPRPPSRPLWAAPSEPEGYSIFVDESGTASFEEVSQPVLCLVGILVNERTIPLFTRKADELLKNYGLPIETEYHANKFFEKYPGEPLNKLSIEKRFELLHEFLSLGMKHAVGVHYLPMLKSFVPPEFRTKIKIQGFDAYSYSIAFFFITLDRACIYVEFGARYKYFYDRTDAYRKDIKRIFLTLSTNKNRRLSFFNLKESPVALESDKSRLIQLADVAAYYLNRHRRFEVKTYQHQESLNQHKDKIFCMYDLIKPKILSFIHKDLPVTVDWKALMDLSLRKKEPSKKIPSSRGKNK